MTEAELIQRVLNAAIEPQASEVHLDAAGSLFLHLEY